MILSYRDKRTEDFANGGDVRAFRGIERQAFKRLDILDAATDLRDLAQLPGNRLEMLKGHPRWHLQHSDQRSMADLLRMAKRRDRSV